MMKAFYCSLFILGIAQAHVGYADRANVVNEDFNSLAFGDTTGINSEITDGSYDAGLRLHNHVVGEVVTPHVNFTSAPGSAFQITTGTNPTGGWGLLSANNSPRAVSLIEGEDVVLSFDMYVQAVPGSSDSPKLELLLTGGDDQSRFFTELTGASVGDIIHVTWTQTVSAAMATATAISPQIGFEGHKNNFSNSGTNIDVAQIDNLILEVPFNPPTYYLDADGGNDSNLGTSPDDAWASLSKASSFVFQPGDQLLLQSGDTFNGKLVLDNENGTAAHPIVIGSYDSGNKPVIDAAGYLAGIQITSCDYIEIRDLEITGDGGAHVDGSNGKDRYGIYIKNSSGNDADHITVSNVYFHTIYPYLPTESEGHNPTTYMGTAIDARGQSSNPSENLLVIDCHFENLGMKVLNLSRQNKVQVINNFMENIGGPAMVPNRCDDLLVRGNTIDGSGQYTDPRMHGRGSGIWPINCNRVLIEKNAFMHARGRYDSCGVHLDIGNTDAIVQYNLSMDNEGGFVEILGVNSNCAYRYNISVNDGARKSGANENGLGVGDGHVIIFSGHNFSGQDRAGPYNSYIYNNTIYVKEDQHCSFSIEDTTEGVLVANNLFFIDGPAEDGTPSWWGAYEPGIEDTVFWTNNVYQRGGIFPEDWIFSEGNPMLGNPNLANPGGLTPEDYIPRIGTFVEGRGIEIPQIPGDPIGLEDGLSVSYDFFGNPIQGLPDIGAVEVGGGTSSATGSAFYGLPAVTPGSSVALSVVPGPAGSEYYFEEMTGNLGANDSDWQSGTDYTDGGLLPNTLYTYAVTMRDALGQPAESSVEVRVIPSSASPFPDHVILDEDFASNPNPANTSSPFPVSTWYLDSAESWSSESGTSVDMYSGGMRVGWGSDEVVLQYFSDQTWDPNGNYEFSGDWKIPSVLANHLGIIVGVGEYDPATGALLQRIKEMTVGELVSPMTNQTDSFILSVSAAELQAAGVSSSSLVGVFLHHDDDGVLYEEGPTKNDVYVLDNLYMVAFSDGIDSDEDGIPDGVELANGLDPNDPSDGHGDADMDGVSNAAEYRLGTGISDTNGTFTITADGSDVIIPEESVLPNRLYILEQKPSLLSSEPWLAVDYASGTAEAGQGNYTFGYTNAVPQSFYRTRVEWE